MNIKYNKINLSKEFCPPETLIRTAAGRDLMPILGYPSIPSIDALSRDYPWTYNLEYAGDADPEIRSLYCYDGNAHLKVCELIRWHDVRIILESTPSNNEIDLPLEGDYLLCSYYLPVGSIDPASSSAWKIPLKTQKSFLLLFGYELRTPEQKQGKERPTRIDPAFLKEYDFTNVQQLLYWERKSFLIKEPPHKTLPFPYFEIEEPAADAPIRFVVGIEFSCCSPASDYEPSKALIAARFFPLFWLISSHPVHRMTAKITIQRPVQSSLGNEAMPLGDIHPALFADRNIVGGLPIFWNNVFDYYLIDPARKEATQNGNPLRYKVVDSLKKERTISNIREVFVEYPIMEPEPAPISKISGYMPSDVRKVSRQGQFDNIHIAPYMITEDSLRLTMAPLCMHDCVHTHFRWGEIFDEPHLYGWADKIPFRKKGAPMVPSNQDIYITLNRSPGFTYEAVINNPSPGEWQCIYHHGSAYGLRLDMGSIKRILGRLVDVSIPLTDHSKGWTDFYESLRYVGSSNMERMRWLSFRGINGVDLLRAF
jgi:hypothetical protein